MDFASYDISSFSDYNKERYNELIFKLNSLENEYYNDTNEMQYLNSQEFINSRQEIIKQLSDIIESENNDKMIKNIDRLLSQYNSDIDILNKKIDNFLKDFITSERLDESIIDKIKKLDIDFININILNKQLISDIDELNTNDYDVKEIKNKLKNLKRKFLNLKIKQVDSYNSYIETINSKVNELLFIIDKSYTNQVLGEIINDLKGIKICDVIIKNYRYSKYLDALEYNKVNKIINNLNSLIEKYSKQGIHDLRDRILYIMKSISNLEKMNNNDINDIQNRINLISNNLLEFKFRLDKNKRYMSVSEYNEYLDKINEYENRFNDYTKKVKDLFNSEYLKIMNYLQGLIGEVNSFGDLIDSLYGNISIDASDLFKKKIDYLNGEILNITEEINNKYDMKIIDSNHYDNLLKTLKELKDKTNDAEKKLLDPKVVISENIYSFLEMEINDINKLLDDLEKLVNDTNDKYIKGNKRSVIDVLIERINVEIKQLKDNLLLCGDDQEKYNDINNKIINIDDRLKRINIDYRSKCPLLVKSVRSANDFFKKHPKIVLIGTGLAGMALLNTAVGPLVIPAIIFGNIIVMEKMPNFKTLYNNVNAFLAKSINAVYTNGVLKLENGLIAKKEMITATLLKALAVSSDRGRNAVNNILNSIKELTNKMQLKNLKQKIKENTDSVSQKSKRTVSNVKNKIRNNKTIKLTLDDLKKLLVKYRESMLSLEQFAIQYNMSNDDMILLEILDKRNGGKR